MGGKLYQCSCGGKGKTEATVKHDNTKATHIVKRVR